MPVFYETKYKIENPKNVYETMINRIDYLISEYRDKFYDYKKGAYYYEDAKIYRDNELLFSGDIVVYPSSSSGISIYFLGEGKRINLTIGFYSERLNDEADKRLYIVKTTWSSEFSNLKEKEILRSLAEYFENKLHEILNKEVAVILSREEKNK